MIGGYSRKNQNKSVNTSILFNIRFQHVRLMKHLHHGERKKTIKSNIGMLSKRERAKLDQICDKDSDDNAGGDISGIVWLLLLSLSDI